MMNYPMAISLVVDVIKDITSTEKWMVLTDFITDHDEVKGELLLLGYKLWCTTEMTDDEWHRYKEVWQTKTEQTRRVYGFRSTIQFLALNQEGMDLTSCADEMIHKLMDDDLDFIQF